MSHCQRVIGKSSWRDKVLAIYENQFYRPALSGSSPIFVLRFSGQIFLASVRCPDVVCSGLCPDFSNLRSDEKCPDFVCLCPRNSGFGHIWEETAHFFSRLEKNIIASKFQNFFKNCHAIFYSENNTKDTQPQICTGINGLPDFLSFRSWAVPTFQTFRW